MEHTPFSVLSKLFNITHGDFVFVFELREYVPNSKSLDIILGSLDAG